MRLRTAKVCFAVIAAVLIVLNGLTLLSALPHTTGTGTFCDSQVGCITVARDFSAYYEAGYRFLFNPTQVYHEGNVSGDYQILPNPQMYRYAPFFLPLFMVPLVVSLDYQNALRAFDVLQFALLPLIAYLLFDIMRRVSARGDSVDNRTFAAFTLTALFALLQPFVLSPSILTFWSWSYWHMWINGEARLLQLFFLVLTVCLVLRGSRLSGLTFVLSSFDPRMSVLCIPLILFLCLKVGGLRRFALGSVASFALIYVPTLLYANLGSQFYGTIFIRDFMIYSYEWIPVLTIISLTATIVALELTHTVEIGKPMVAVGVE
ncbi:MAG: hypothetical protein ABSA72_07045 [Nitrososphaerales archaeon]|jgi:hypothetical protein